MGRIIVDLVNPHIIEDMNYFRPTALHFKKDGTPTSLRPNPNPNSDFGKWVRTEIDRIWNGMVRESDGEWVTGDMYFYLNYTPIIQSKVKKGTKRADRVVDFPEVWEGIYWRFHYLDQSRNGGLYNDFTGGQHAAEIAARGKSKSYSIAAMLAKLFVTGDNEETSRNVRGLITAYQKEYLTKDGTLNKFVEMIDFVAQNTQFPSKRLKSSLQEMTWKMGYIDSESNTFKGTLNEVIGVSSKDDVDKLRGKRASKIMVEEFGNFPKIIDIYRIILPSVQEGDIAFGQIYLVGTGGSEGADFAGANEIIYNPKGYYMYALPNVFDRNSQGKTSSIFFFGAYVNRKECYNSDGVSDVVKALIELLLNRFNVKYNSTDPMALTRTKAENPITIQEAIMKRDSTIYPVTDLTDQLNSLDLDPKSYDNIYTGRLGLKDGKVKYEPSYDVKPIMEFPHKDNKLEGAIQIYKMPELDSRGLPFPNRYISGIDPYDDDVSETLSLGNIWILDLWTDQIVFEYTGRPQFADDFYETCRRALLMYDARSNYENDKKGLFKYFSQHNCLYLLTDALEFLRDRDNAKGENLFGNKAKGTKSSAPVKAYARRCIRDWLLKPIVRIDTINGVDTEVTVPQLTTLKARAFIKELIIWNADGNFDRHDGFAMMMLLREDKLRLLGTKSGAERDKENNKDYLGEDSFFKNNYDARIKGNNPKYDADGVFDYTLASKFKTMINES